MWVSGSFTCFQSESSNGDLQLCNVLVPVAHFADKQTEAQRGQVICVQRRTARTWICQAPSLLWVSELCTYIAFL